MWQTTLSHWQVRRDRGKVSFHQVAGEVGEGCFEQEFIREGQELEVVESPDQQEAVVSVLLLEQGGIFLPFLKRRRLNSYGKNVLPHEVILIFLLPAGDAAAGVKHVWQYPFGTSDSIFKRFPLFSQRKLPLTDMNSFKRSATAIITKGLNAFPLRSGQTRISALNPPIQF